MGYYEDINKKIAEIVVANITDQMLESVESAKAEYEEGLEEIPDENEGL
uniref:Uncharacterized protein n=1 Tax=viral metagenome TaxID=1070528 RepID=A0A6H1Z7S9_9ZZZZ